MKREVKKMEHVNDRVDKQVWHRLEARVERQVGDRVEARVRGRVEGQVRRQVIWPIRELIKEGYGKNR